MAARDIHPANDLDVSAVPAAGTAGDPAASAARRPWLTRRVLTVGLLAVWGPGLIVMLADTDAGCLITAAQSGAQWGYAMVLPQLVLIPILFMAQEIVVRLGVVTGKGHGALIREHFGVGWGACRPARCSCPPWARC